MSDEKPGREDDALAGPELTDEQLDAEAPGVDDAAELEAAEAELAAVRAEGLPPTRDCDAEAAALALDPPSAP